MAAWRRGSWSVLAILAAGALLATTWQQSRSVRANLADAPPVARWDYNTQTVPTADLQAKLFDLGNEGWEVIAVTPYETTLEQGDDGKPHLIIVHFQLTAKRPLP